MPTTRTNLILAGDFNCILSQTDSTGQRNYSSALANLVNGLGLTDVYETKATRRIHTHYTSTGSSRLDRIYISRNLQPPKRRRNDRRSVHKPSSCSNPNGNRKPNNASWERLQENEHVPTKRDRIPTNITRTLEQMEDRKYYPNDLLWWERHIKHRLRQLFTREGSERRGERESSDGKLLL